MKRVNRNMVHADVIEGFGAVLQTHVDDLSPMEMLALASHFVGSIIALQDQTKITTAQAMEMVLCNIQVGNQMAIEAVIGTPASQA